MSNLYSAVSAADLRIFSFYFFFNKYYTPDSYIGASSSVLFCPSEAELSLDLVCYLQIFFPCDATPVRRFSARITSHMQITNARRPTKR